MSNWEKHTHAKPGEIIVQDGMVISRLVSRPLFYSPTFSMWDDQEVDEIKRIELNDVILVVACFPDGIENMNRSQGAVIMVPSAGLWWWPWQ